jgi:hypothetical protein
MLPAQRLHQMELFETVAPEVKCAVKPPTMAAPRHGMMVWQASAQHPGHFKPMVETHPAVVDLKNWNPKIYGCSKEVIRTLVECGMVEGERLSPRTLSIRLESWFAHRAKMRENPWFWSDAENLKKYSEAYRRMQQREGAKGRSHRRRKKRAGVHSEGGIAPGGVSGVETEENASDPLGELGERASRREGVASPAPSPQKHAKSTTS